MEEFVLGEILSYKEICGRLGEDPRRGKAMQLHMAKIADLVTLEKCGRKYAVVDIPEVVRPSFHSDSVFPPLLFDSLVLHLSTRADQEDSLSLDGWFEALGLFSGNIRTAPQAIRSAINSKFNLPFYRLLDQLQRGGYVKYRKIQNVVDECHVLREATDAESSYIQSVSRSISAVDPQNMSAENRQRHYAEVNQILARDKGWKYTYKTLWVKFLPPITPFLRGTDPAVRRQLNSFAINSLKATISKKYHGSQKLISAVDVLMLDNII